MVRNEEAFYWEDYVETTEPRMYRALVKLKLNGSIQDYYRVVTYDRILNLWREDRGAGVVGRYIHQFEIGKIMYLK